MSASSDFSTNLINGLNTQMPTTTFYPGVPPDVLPPASTAVGYVWVETMEQDSSNQLIEKVTAGVRVYPIQDERFNGDIPIDPTPLYDAASDVQAMTFADWEPSNSAPWFFNCIKIDFNHEEQYIEAEIEGTTWNDAAVS